MRRIDLYKSIGYARRRVLCEDKIRYPSRLDAVNVAYEYNRRILFAGMDAYRCEQHGCWHVGHRDRRRRAVSRLREDVMWFELWGSRN